MSQDLAAVATSHNPLLETFSSSLSAKLNADVNLVDTIDSGQFTIIAPIDSAWANLDTAAVDNLKSDSRRLNTVLMYHVISGQLNPSEIIGNHQTLMGDNITVTGGGENLTFDQAKLVCGGVHTANATIYMVDSVLTPPAS